MARKVLTTATGENQALSRVAEINPLAALLWPAMYPHFDDWGRMDGRIRRIRADVFWAFDNVTAQMLEEALGLFEQAGLIVRYEVAGCAYIAIPHDDWRAAQSHFKKAKWCAGGDEASDFPPPPGYQPLESEGEPPLESPVREVAGKIPQAAGERPPHAGASLPPSDTDTLSGTQGGLAVEKHGRLPEDELPPPLDASEGNGLTSSEAHLRRLYEAFRSERHPNMPPDAWNRTEWRRSLPAIRAMHDGGATVATVKQATAAALRRFKNPDQVTPGSVAANWTALLEPDPPARERRETIAEASVALDEDYTALQRAYLETKAAAA